MNKFEFYIRRSLKRVAYRIYFSFYIYRKLDLRRGIVIYTK